jgi:hypothetical protein
MAFVGTADGVPFYLFLPINSSVAPNGRAAAIWYSAGEQVVEEISRAERGELGIDPRRVFW